MATAYCWDLCRSLYFVLLVSQARALSLRSSVFLRAGGGDASEASSDPALNSRESVPTTPQRLTPEHNQQPVLEQQGNARAKPSTRSSAQSAAKECIKEPGALVELAASTYFPSLGNLAAKMKSSLKSGLKELKHAVTSSLPSLADLKNMFAHPPKPPPLWRPPFKPPEKRVKTPGWTREDKLVYRRFLTCYNRRSATAEELRVRPPLLQYREQVLKIIPGLTAPLSLGVIKLLTTSPATTKMVVRRFQDRRNRLRYQTELTKKELLDQQRVWRGSLTPQGQWVANRPWESMVKEDYLTAPDMLADIMWEYWCKSSSPCTGDENCLIAHLSLLAVLGSEDINAHPDVNGRQAFPQVELPGDEIGQPYHCPSDEAKARNRKRPQLHLRAA
jgi:hypothetical protein